MVSFVFFNILSFLFFYDNKNGLLTALVTLSRIWLIPFKLFTIDLCHSHAEYAAGLSSVLQRGQKRLSVGAAEKKAMQVTRQRIKYHR